MCDWRVNISGCEGEQSFRIVHLVGVSLSAYNTFIFLAIVLFRLLVRKDQPLTFTYGGNAAVLLVFFVALIALVYHSLVLSNASIIANDIWWGLVISSLALPMAVYLSSFVEALPPELIQNTLAARCKQIFPSHLVPIVFLFEFILVNCVLLGLSGSYTDDNPNLSHSLFVAHCVFSAVNLLVCMVLYLFFWNNLMSLIRARSIKDLNILTASRKLTSHSIVLSILAIYFGVTLLMMASIPNFFSNLSISFPISATTIAMIQAGGLTSSTVIIVLDTKRAMMKSPIQLEV